MNVKKMMLLILCLLLGTTACDLQQTDIPQESSQETEQSSAASAENLQSPNSTSDVNVSLPTDESTLYPLVYPLEGDYDYHFYLRGLYLSSDKSGDWISIQPIHIISNPQNNDNPYHIEEYTDETLSLPLKPETQYHIINWNKDLEMAEQSLNQPLSSLVAVCVFKDPRISFEYLRKNHGKALASKPMVLNLDEDGNVDLIVELYVQSEKEN